MLEGACEEGQERKRSARIESGKSEGFPPRVEIFEEKPARQSAERQKKGKASIAKYRKKRKLSATDPPPWKHLSTGA